MPLILQYTPTLCFKLIKYSKKVKSWSFNIKTLMLALQKVKGTVAYGIAEGVFVSQILVNYGSKVLGRSKDTIQIN